MQKYEYQYKIFGISERNTALKLKFYENFGSPTFAESLSFPEVITPMNNGKYLFYQQSFITNRWAFPEEFLIEQWEKNEDWNRSSINFPFVLTGESLWIFKV